MDKSNRNTTSFCANDDKINYTTNASIENIISYVQSFIRKAGLDSSDLELDSPNFGIYLLILLNKSVTRLHDLKVDRSKKISKEEKYNLQNLYEKTNFILCNEKILYAAELFDDDFPIHLKNTLMISGMGNDCYTYISLFTNFVDSLTEIFSSVSHSAIKKIFDNQSILEDECVLQSNKESDKHTEKSKTIQHVGIKIEPSEPDIDLICTTEKHKIYCITNACKKYALKVLIPDKTTLKDVKSLDNEFEIAKLALHPAFRTSVARTIYQSNQALVLEWAPGHSISSINEKTRFGTKKFLSLGREMVSALLSMHMKQIMNLNLMCDHMIYDPQTKSIKIIGLGSCTPFTSKKNFISNEELCQRDLRCVSPEQTGRVNREVDYRSDIYSLGVIFYKMLTGEYPFDAENALDLVHLHILQEPESMCNINPDIPTKISEFVSKLMAKYAQDRYLSAKGIIHDLDLMISEIDTDCTLSSVTLGQHDLSKTFCIPQKLYGRTNEYNVLCSVVDKLDSNAFEIAFISGKSGSGKSALVAELYKAVAKKYGYFICGKFDQYKRDPYAAIIQAVEHFCNDLLLKEESTIDKFKANILSAVGEECKLLTDVISNLHLIVGEQPCISDVFGKDAKNRFNYVFVNFLKAICSTEAPIILVLEDLQWLDNESDDIVSTILADKCIKNLMLIGIYRENEVGNDHPVVKLLKHMKDENFNATEIQVDNLDHESVNELISDALCISNLQTYPLTSFIHEKTKGNPFFVNQILKSLYEQGLIFLSNEEFKWKWDVSIFGTNDIGENVLELLRRRILAFDSEVQQALKVASSLGSPFSLSTLKLIVNKESVIKSVLSTGMITQCERSNAYYRFVHDQIQEAAKSLLPKDPSELFYYIGKKLCFVFNEEELNENIFIIVKFLYSAMKKVKDKEERLNVAKLSLQAAEKSMTMTAYEKACKFSKNGIKLLGRRCWNTQYDLSIKLYYLSATAAYCVSDFAQMAALQNEVFHNVTNTWDLVQFIDLKIRYLNDQRKYDLAIHEAMVFLDKIDENIKMNWVSSIACDEFREMRSFIDCKSNHEVLRVKRTDDDKIIAIMMILSRITSSAYFSQQDLYFRISFQIVKLTFDFGFSKYSPIGFVTLAVFLYGTKETVLGYRFASLSLELLETVQCKEIVPIVKNAYYTFVSHFHASIHDVFEPLLKVYKVSLQVGSHEIFLYSSSTYAVCAFLSGKQLENLLSDIEKLQDRRLVSMMSFSSIHQAVINFAGKNSSINNPALLCGDKFNYTSCFDENEKGYNTSRGSLICALVAYLFGDYKSASQFIEICRPHENTFQAMFIYPMFLYYDGLISLELAKYTKQRDSLANAEQSILKLKSFADNAPMNFLNKCQLLQAEMAMLAGTCSLAQNFYNDAITLSDRYNFILDEALACERAALFFLKYNSMSSASQLFERSYKCYNKWGGFEKMKQFKKKYSRYFNVKCPMDLKSYFDISSLQLDKTESEDCVSVLTEAYSATVVTSHREKRPKMS